MLAVSNVEDIEMAIERVATVPVAAVIADVALPTVIAAVLPFIAVMLLVLIAPLVIVYPVGN